MSDIIWGRVGAAFGHALQRRLMGAYWLYVGAHAPWIATVNNRGSGSRLAPVISGLFSQFPPNSHDGAPDMSQAESTYEAQTCMLSSAPAFQKGR